MFRYTSSKDTVYITSSKSYSWNTEIYNSQPLYRRCMENNLRYTCDYRVSLWLAKLKWYLLSDALMVYNYKYAKTLLQTIHTRNTFYMILLKLQAYKSDNNRKIIVYMEKLQVA